MNGERPEPLVAVLCSTPILCEALSAALESIADVRRFPAGRGDVAGLLRSLAPDGVVVDSEEDLEAAAEFASEFDAPLVHVSLRRDRLRVLADGEWQEPESQQASPEAIRNALVGGIYGRARRA
jgi:hypothetical protein